ncbi:phage tail protein [Pseudomonas sp. FME51]|uniref:phage tail protein n=2 Tax=Gammaproteobacteria TaxID=1236 RepID=UPI001866FBC3|nr:phage tail protein [Pseudomonas sp. FME51]
MTKIFKVPFATQGDKIVVPVETQPDGSVSYTQGYSYDYERDQTSDPSAKDIEREKMNSLFHDITESIGEMQLQGFAKWSEAGKPYPIRSVVYHKNKAWQSKIENNNVEPVTGNAWTELKADTTASDVGAYSKGESDKRFQPLGNYILSGYSYSKSETDNKYQPRGNYAPAGNYANKGDSYTKTESDGRYQGKGNYANKGDSYTAIESDGRYQSKGNYADKSSSLNQDFNGPIYATNNVGAKAGERRIKFELTAGRPEITHTDGVNGWRGVILPDKTGTLALMSDIEEAGKNYQLKGNYADKGSKSTQKFEGPLEVTGEVQSSSEDVRLALKTATNTPTIIVKYGKSGTWKTIVVPDKSGTMALAGESYTKLESDNRYSPKLPLLSFSGKESKIISPNNKILIFVNDDGATGGYDRDAQATVWGFDKRGFMTRGTVHFDRMSGVYSQSQVDAKLNGYQSKGNYADKSSSLNQDFNGPIYATNNVGAKAGERRIKFELTAGRPEITHTDGVNGWRGVVLPDKTGTLALMSDIEEANNIPVGSPIPWSLATAPSGYLICQGQTFNKATYPKLSIAYPSGRLPDLRADVIRGLDAGRGVDVGRQILSEQMGNSLLSTNLFNDDSEVATQYEKKVGWIGSTGTNNQGGYGIWQQIEGKNSNETRMRNIAFLYIVRAA